MQSLLAAGRDVIVVGDVNIVRAPMDHCDPMEYVKMTKQPFEASVFRRWLTAMLVDDATARRLRDRYRDRYRLTSTAGGAAELGTSPARDVTDPGSAPATAAEAATAPPVGASATTTTQLVVSHSRTPSSSGATRDAVTGDRGGGDGEGTGGDAAACGCKLVDAFRVLHPDRKCAFTCWNASSSARENNYGTRIDYALLSPRLFTRCAACDIMQDFQGQ